MCACIYYYNRVNRAVFGFDEKNKNVHKHSAAT